MQTHNLIATIDRRESVDGRSGPEEPRKIRSWKKRGEKSSKVPIREGESGPLDHGESRTVDLTLLGVQRSDFRKRGK
jgi:hypothetical protein